MGEIANAQGYFSFNASTQTYVFESSTTSMAPRLGYTLTRDIAGPYLGTFTASFTGGIPNNGDVNAPLGFSNDADPTNDWNIIVNPYTSAFE